MKNSPRFSAAAASRRDVLFTTSDSSTLLLSSKRFLAAAAAAAAAPLPATATVSIQLLLPLSSSSLPAFFAEWPFAYRIFRAQSLKNFLICGKCVKDTLFDNLIASSKPSLRNSLAVLKPWSATRRSSFSG